ncbi:MAG TPA: gluconate 2-dehydrogenase subunit 3 family protein [Caulobacteraceae bacterium]|jgi:hypothetical protein
MTERYPGYDVLSKWDSVSFNEVTRRVLWRRLDQTPPRRFFTEAEWTLVDALAAHLAPTPERGEAIPITPWIDAELHEGRGEGWRIPGIPPMQEAWRRALAAVEAEARVRFGRSFTQLAEDERERLCRRLHDGHAEAPEWGALPVKAAFGMLLNAIVNVYYAHPAAWNEMGFGGPAGPRGYVRTGLNERDPWEAREGPAHDGPAPNEQAHERQARGAKP